MMLVRMCANCAACIFPEEVVMVQTTGSNVSPEALAAAIAERTRRMRIGEAIVSAGLYDAAVDADDDEGGGIDGVCPAR